MKDQDHEDSVTPNFTNLSIINHEFPAVSGKRDIDESKVRVADSESCPRSCDQLIANGLAPSDHLDPTLVQTSAALHFQKFEGQACMTMQAPLNWPHHWSPRNPTVENESFLQAKNPAKSEPSTYGQPGESKPIQFKAKQSPKSVAKTKGHRGKDAQALMAQLAKCFKIGDVVEMKRILDARVYTDDKGQRDRGCEDALSEQEPSRKRKRITCERCSKTMTRYSDLK